MKILLTGGTGVAGLGTIPALVAAGHKLKLLSRHANEDVKGLPKGIEPVQADLAKKENLTGALDGCELVIHIAGIVEEHPPEITFERVNVQGCAHLLDACKGQPIPPRFLYLSSLGAERGESDYHKSKFTAEELVRGYAGSWIILRPGAIYGPGDETISLLLKMVRILPAVPMVGEGEQPFQPIWYRDFGYAVGRLVEHWERFERRTLEIAGRERVGTDEALERISRITDRNPAKLSVPAWLAQTSTKVLESFGGAGQALLKRMGLTPPITSEKLSMLLEGNVIPDGKTNLADELGMEMTSLEDGLVELVNLVPEQLPGSGVGAIRTGYYWADIHGGRFSAEQLLEYVCEHIDEVMPIDFAAEPQAPKEAHEGEALTAEIAGRGHVQVRMEERTQSRVTFATLESHPLAGVMQLESTQVEGAVRFAVRTLAQPADALDWVAMRTIGAPLQHKNWRDVVKRVVKLSGGEATGGQREKFGSLSEDEAKDFGKWVKGLVQRRQRADLEAQVDEIA